MLQTALLTVPYDQPMQPPIRTFELTGHKYLKDRNLQTSSVPQYMTIALQFDSFYEHNFFSFFIIDSSESNNSNLIRSCEFECKCYMKHQFFTCIWNL